MRRNYYQKISTPSPAKSQNVSSPESRESGSVRVRLTPSTVRRWWPRGSHYPTCQNKPKRLLSRMEKRTPQCKLSVVKALVGNGQVRTTNAARVGATALGFDYSGMLAVIAALKSTDFYKSMTTHADHTIWQDVYHTCTSAGDLYVKLTVVDDVLIVSFKEL